MLKREAHGLMDELLEAFHKEVLPFGTELYFTRRESDYGIRIDYEGSSLTYWDSTELARSIKQYTNKLRRVEDADEGALLLELLKPRE